MTSGRKSLVDAESRLVELVNDLRTSLRKNPLPVDVLKEILMEAAKQTNVRLLCFVWLRLEALAQLAV